VKILVCGGRYYSNWPKVREVLSALCDKHSIYYSVTDNWLPSDVTIIEGGQTGADALAASFAIVNWTQLEEYEADWTKFGSAAGPLRNQRMLDEGNPDLVVAFPGNNGTADMTTRARAAGIPVIVVEDGDH
jgi:YspA, cpYpsA-related SLOG family